MIGAIRMKRLGALLQDHPKIVSITLLSLVVIHYLLTLWGVVPNTWEGLLTDESRISVYLAACTVAAIVAGFAGVVVTFGLTARGDRFRTLRVQAGRALGDNWTSTSISGFVAAGLSLAAAILDASGLGGVSPWLLELSLLILTHGTIRIVWLLRELADTMRIEDEDKLEDKQKKTVSKGDFS